MLEINGKNWNKLTLSDVEACLNALEESFFFEFKRDDVAPKQIAREISSFANTYGGYIFLGVDDKKKIMGCNKWNEERIHTTIHDSITPIPIFDVKKFNLENGKPLYIVRIDEGGEPPYITNTGFIFERLSSGAYKIKDSSRLIQLYWKRQDEQKRIQEKISIPPVVVQTQNVFGYIDIGFITEFRNDEEIQAAFDKIDLGDLKDIVSTGPLKCNGMHLGESLWFSIGEFGDKNASLPSGLNNFMEIMSDGSVRLRLILWNDQFDGKNRVNMINTLMALETFRNVYEKMFDWVFQEIFVYAKKYENMTITKQFYPYYRIENSTVSTVDGLTEIDEFFERAEQYQRESVGINVICSGDRVPKVGFRLIDQRLLSKKNEIFSAENIINNLFFCSFFDWTMVEKEIKKKKMEDNR